MDDIYMPLIRPRATSSLAADVPLTDVSTSNNKQSDSSILRKKDEKKGLQFLFNAKAVEKAGPRSMDFLVLKGKKKTRISQISQQIAETDESLKESNYLVGNEQFPFETFLTKSEKDLSKVNRQQTPVHAKIKIQSLINVHRGISSGIPGDIRLHEKSLVPLDDTDLVKCVAVKPRKDTDTSDAIAYQCPINMESILDANVNTDKTTGRLFRGNNAEVLGMQSSILSVASRLRKYKTGLSPDDRLNRIQTHLNEYSKLHIFDQPTINIFGISEQLSDDIEDSPRGGDKKIITRILSPLTSTHSKSFPTEDFPLSVPNAHGRRHPQMILSTPVRGPQTGIGPIPMTPSSVSTDGHGPGYVNIVNEYLSDTLGSSLSALGSSATGSDHPNQPNEPALTAGDATTKPPTESQGSMYDKGPQPTVLGLPSADMDMGSPIDQKGSSTNIIVSKTDGRRGSAPRVPVVNARQSKASMLSMVRMVPQETDPASADGASQTGPRRRSRERSPHGGAVEHIMLELPLARLSVSTGTGSSPRNNDATSPSQPRVSLWTASSEPEFSHSFHPNDLPSLSNEHDDQNFWNDSESPNGGQKTALTQFDEDDDDTAKKEEGEMEVDSQEGVRRAAQMALTQEEEGGREEEKTGGIATTTAGEFDDGEERKADEGAAVERVGTGQEEEDGSLGVVSFTPSLPSIPSISTMPDIVTSPSTQYGLDPGAYGSTMGGGLFCSLCPRGASLWCPGCTQAYCPRCWGRVPHHDSLGQADLWAEQSSPNARRIGSRSGPTGQLNVTLGPGGALILGSDLDRGGDKALKRTLSYPRRITGSTISRVSTGVSFDGTGADVQTQNPVQSQGHVPVMSDVICASRIAVTQGSRGGGRRGYFATRRRPKKHIEPLPAAGKDVYLRKDSADTKVKKKSSRRAISPDKETNVFLPDEWKKLDGNTFKHIEVHKGVTVYTSKNNLW